MLRTRAGTKNKSETPPKEGRKKRTRVRWVPWKSILYAGIPVALLVYYLAIAAPSLIPVPPGVKVPYPVATEFLEKVCAWCGEHRVAVGLMGFGLLAAGIVLRFWVRLYYWWLGILAALVLIFTFLSISAPTDRLLKSIEDTLPEGSRVPDYLPGKVRK